MFDLELIYKNNKRFSLILCAFLFLVIFRPPIVRIDLTYIIILLDIAIILYSLYKHTYTYRIKKYFISSLIGFVPFFIYFTLCQFVRIIFDNSNTGIFLEQYLALLKTFFYIVLTLIAAISLLDIFDINLSCFIENLEIVFCIQLFCVIGAFFSSQIKNVFLQLIYKNVSVASVVTSTRLESYFRCYGFADNLFDSFGYITSLAIVVFFEYGIKHKKRFPVVLSFMLLLIPLLNARTGLLLALIGMFVVFIKNFDANKLLKYFFVGLVVLLFTIAIYKYLPETLSRWIDVGVKATINLFHGEKSSAYDEILGADLVWPTSILFGEGTAPEVIWSHKGIDSGYIQCVWRFGLFGSILLFLGFVKLFYIGKQKSDYVLAMAFIFFIYLFKLYGVFNFGSVLIVYLLPVLIRREEFLGENAVYE